MQVLSGAQVAAEKAAKKPEKETAPFRYMFLLSPSLPYTVFAFMVAFHLTARTEFCFLTSILVHLVVPLLDYVVGESTDNLSDAAAKALDRDPFYRWSLCAFVPGQYMVNVYGLHLICTRPETHWYQALGILAAVGAVNGMGLNTAHELMHKLPSFERWLSKVGIAPACYGHMYVDHIWSHHKRAATPEDPVCARMGESFWRFMPRSIFGAIASAWDLERRRLAREGKGVWSVENHNLQAWGLSVALYLTVLCVYGPYGMLMLALQVPYAASLLEVVAYIEHYGLLRQRKPDGEYEPITPQHSWNSNCIVSNLFLYQLERHSDHHAYPTRSYQSLRHYDESPQLPSGYGSMVPVAYIPWLWFRLMDPRVAALYKYDLTKAHMHPPARARYLKSNLHRASHATE